MTYNKGEKMSSKEALEHIIFVAKLDKPISSVYYQELIEAKEKIEKDLEILEIFKKHISIRIENFNMGNLCLKKESIRYNGLDLDITNEEEYNKIKDWILK